MYSIPQALLTQEELSVNIKRIDPDLPLPAYATNGSVGFDLYCRVATTIEPFTLGFVPGNVIVQTPAGFMLMVTLRSSTPRRKGLLCPHGVGIVDQDYCGENDELLVQVYNFTNTPVTIERGERIAQGIFLPVAQCKWQEVQEMKQTDRGGFGSTGN